MRALIKVPARVTVPASVTLSLSKGERTSHPREPLQGHNRRSPFDKLRVTSAGAGATTPGAGATTAGVVIVLSAAVVTLAGAMAALALTEATLW